MLSHSVESDSLQPHGLPPARLLCPWDSPGKNTGVGCHALLQGIAPTQELDPCLPGPLHWQVGSLPLTPLGKSMQQLSVPSLQPPVNLKLFQTKMLFKKKEKMGRPRWSTGSEPTLQCRGRRFDPWSGK